MPVSLCFKLHKMAHTRSNQSLRIGFADFSHHQASRTPVRLDINTLIDQIMVDPHATAPEARAVKDEAASIGFTSEVLTRSCLNCRCACVLTLCGRRCF